MGGPDNQDLMEVIRVIDARVIILWLHITAAMTWIGGMIFVTFILIPALNKIGGPSLVARFRPLVWAAIGIIALTGLLNLHFLGVGRATLASWWGLVFAIKMLLVAGLLFIFIMAPRRLEDHCATTDGGVALPVNLRRVFLLHLVAIALGLGAVLAGLIL